MSFPELLTLLPAPEIKEEYIADGKVNLTVPDAVKASEEYCLTVAQYVRDNQNKLSVEKDIIPAVEFAMRLFNSENFSGSLSNKERQELAVIYKRFGEADLLEDCTAVKKARMTKEELEVLEQQGLTEDLRAMCYQRLLTRDGEMPVPSVRLCGLLLCAVALVSVDLDPSASGISLDPRDEKQPLFPLTSIWRLRVYYRHQLCLQHRAHTVFLQVSSCVDALLSQPESAITVATLLEISHVQQYYHRRDMAAATVRRAEKLSGLETEETSMMGVRTRWQQHQLVQMLLTAKSAREVPPDSETEEQPNVINGEKDGHDLLDRPRATPESEPVPVTPLHPEDKAIILSLCMDIENRNPHHGLTQHHMMTYIERLVVDPAVSPFMVASQILLTRCRLEVSRNRVQERAHLQLTELLDQFTITEREPERRTFARSGGDYFYCVPYPPIWTLRAELAAMCFEENLFKTALDIYEAIQDWQNIIECCKKLDKRRRAETLARDLLERDPANPMLWVALGEATRDDQYLWKAWELSGHTVAAPMRVLARLALDREHFEKVVEYFDMAVKINPIFGGDWFSLGYAALRLKNTKRGGEAFTRVCQINPNDAYAWNNLASILLHEGKLRPAYNCMSQALRQNRRSWQMWQNYFQMGCELNEVFESTNALNIALDISKRAMQLDRATMEKFVAITIAYLRGEIAGSPKEELPSVTNNIYKSLASEPSPEDITHIPTTDDDGEVEVVGDLQPFGADVELPEDMFHHDSPYQVNEEARQATRQRHRERVQALFTRLLDTFVTDPDLYHCAATLFSYLDGPLESYRYRQKELRACQQKEHWERDETKFKRTVECLESLFHDATEASELLKERLLSNDHPSEEDQKHVLEALVQLQSNVKAVLEASEEHMGQTASYEGVRDLAKRVRDAVREAKSTFILS